jgi:hypothetical protein
MSLRSPQILRIEPSETPAMVIAVPGLFGCIGKRWSTTALQNPSGNYRVWNGGHVLECGSVLPLLSALSVTALSSQYRRLRNQIFRFLLVPK